MIVLVMLCDVTETKGGVWNVHFDLNRSSWPVQHISTYMQAILLVLGTTEQGYASTNIIMSAEMLVSCKQWCVNMPSDFVIEYSTTLKIMLLSIASYQGVLTSALVTGNHLELSYESVLQVCKFVLKYVLHIVVLVIVQRSNGNVGLVWPTHIPKISSRIPVYALWMNPHGVNYCKVFIMLLIMEECLLQLSVLAAKPFLWHTLAQLANCMVRLG